MGVAPRVTPPRSGPSPQPRPSFTRSHLSAVLSARRAGSARRAPGTAPTSLPTSRGLRPPRGGLAKRTAESEPVQNGFLGAATLAMRGQSAQQSLIAEAPSCRGDEVAVWPRYRA